MNLQCIKCKFFQPGTSARDTELKLGTCHIRPPQAAGHPEDWDWEFPKVSYSDWCGEWAK